MPSLQKFHANVARHVKLMDKNIAANLIRHEYIVTTRAKAKRAQSKFESFLAKTLNENKSMENKSLQDKLHNNKGIRYLQPPDIKDAGAKVLTELAERYSNRTHGFTRVIKLEPRLGEDKAPMSVLELVDSEFEVKFWYYAKIAARLQLQQLPYDKTTELEINKLTALRHNGPEKFEQAVEVAKKQFFKYDAETQEIQDPKVIENLRNVPRKSVYKFDITASKKFNTKPRAKANASDASIPASPFTQ